jgi:hypothetical protein
LEARVPHGQDTTCSHTSAELSPHPYTLFHEKINFQKTGILPLLIRATYLDDFVSLLFGAEIGADELAVVTLSTPIAIFILFFYEVHLIRHILKNTSSPILNFLVVTLMFGSALRTLAVAIFIFTLVSNLIESPTCIFLIASLRYFFVPVLPSGGIGIPFSTFISFTIVLHFGGKSTSRTGYHRCPIESQSCHPGAYTLLHQIITFQKTNLLEIS